MDNQYAWVSTHHYNHPSDSNTSRAPCHRGGRIAQTAAGFYVLLALVDGVGPARSLPRDWAEARREEEASQ